jgi:hypothetical protein
MNARFSLAVALLLSTSCATRLPSVDGNSVSSDALARHIEVLASDAFEGRAPGTAGEERTVTYIVEQMRDADVQPGNGGSWFQEVPLVEIAPSTSAILRIEGAKGGAAFEWGEEAVIVNPAARPNARLDGSDLVFAGYGLSGPGRDDFAGVDLAGKTVVFLAGLPEALKDAKLNAAASAKVAEATRRGAAGTILVLPSSYSDDQWAALVKGERRPDLQLEGKQSGPMVDVRVRHGAADHLFAASGHDFAALTAAAGRPGFRAVPLGSRATVRLDGRVRRFVSRNVVGVLPGAKRPDEFVLFLAHWDHLGRCAPGEADEICNGAIDNASGVGGLIELARAFARGKRPDRSILFLATTAEEGGLMGAKHFAEKPPVPLSKIVGGLGADTIASGEVPADVVVLGAGLSPDLDRVIAAAARSQGRQVVVDRSSEAFFERSDHYPLAAAGVPVLIATSVFAPGARVTTDNYLAERYHKPSDEYRPGMPLAGATLDIDLAYRVGLRLADSGIWPGWKPGTPYAVARAQQR